MVVIYLTGITIAMLNLTGIGFVIFMVLLNNQSSSKLKKANFKNNNIIKNSIKNKKESIENKIDRLPIIEGKSANHRDSSMNKANTRAAVAGIAATAGADALSGNFKKSKTGDFNNIDDILDDLDLSDFDNLDLDDFN